MAENEVRFPVRFAKNRTSSVVYRQFNDSPLAVAALLLPYLPGNGKPGVC